MSNAEAQFCWSSVNTMYRSGGMTSAAWFWPWTQETPPTLNHCHLPCRPYRQYCENLEACHSAAWHNYAQLKFWEMRKGDGRINYDMLGLGLLKSGFLSGRYPSYCIYTRLYSISLRKIDPENASMINMLQQQSTSFPPSKASASEPRHHLPTPSH